LRTAGIESANLESQVLAAHTCGMSRSELLAHPEWDVPHEAEVLLQRRLSGEPLAYILGHREFYGREFRVSSCVLIPRPETETLVDACLNSAQKSSARDVLDLGAGSGCIGVTLKLEAPRLKVVLADVSRDALEVARENALTLEADVELVESDGFESLFGRRFDLIVTNPPYVAESDALPAEVRDYEPPLALFAGNAGLDFYRRLATEAKDHLTEGGKLFAEVGDRQAEEAAALFESQKWILKAVHRDLLGFDRVLELAQ